MSTTVLPPTVADDRVGALPMVELGEGVPDPDGDPDPDADGDGDPVAVGLGMTTPGQ